MDEFKPEDELKPDLSDRRPVRSRKSAEEYEKEEPQFNVDDIDIDDEDDRRPTRNRRVENEPEDEVEEDYDDEQDEAAAAADRRPAKRKKAPAKGPVSRQHLMMGVGILALLILIIGIGSALKSPSNSDNSASNGNERNIQLNNAGDQQANNGQQPVQNMNAQQEVNLPPIASTPTQGQPQTAPADQQRVEVQGDLNNALTQPQQSQQINNAASSTLPTAPATVAQVNNSQHREASRPEQTTAAAASRPERKTTVIEPAPRKVQPVETKPQQTAKAVPVQSKPEATKHIVTTAPAPAKAPQQTAAATPAKAPAATPKAPAATTAPAASAPAAAAATGVSAGNVSALKSAAGSNYTLQLSSSSNFNNLNAWAKKENLQNFVVYETKRNGQPWYVLVSGVYGSKDEAKRAVSALPSDVQAKNPWAKPIHQVQSDLKQ